MSEFRGKVQHVDYWGNTLREVKKEDTSVFKVDGKVSKEELGFLQESLTKKEEKIELPKFPGDENLFLLREKLEKEKKDSVTSIFNYSQEFIAKLKTIVEVENKRLERQKLIEFIETDINKLVKNIIGKDGIKVLQCFLGLLQNGEYDYELFKGIVDFQRKFTPENVDGIANEKILYKIQTFLNFSKNMKIGRAEDYYKKRKEDTFEDLYSDILKLRGGEYYTLFRNAFSLFNDDTGYNLKEITFDYGVTAFDVFGDLGEIYVEGEKYIADKKSRKFISEETKKELVLTKESIIYTENLQWTKSLTGLDEFYKKHGIVIKEMAKHLGFTQEYLLSILSIESIFRVTAQSGTGSTGYMQVTRTMFSDFITKKKGVYFYGRGMSKYLPILKDFSDFFVNLMSDKESVNLMQRFQDISYKNEKGYNKIVKDVTKVLKTKSLVEKHPRLNLVMGGTYLRVVHDTLGLRHMYGKLGWYKYFLKMKLDRINEVLIARGADKITESDLEEFKNRIRNKELSKEEIRLMLAARIYNGSSKNDEGIPHKYYYGAIVYFLDKYLKKQRNQKNVVN